MPEPHEPTPLEVMTPARALEAEQSAARPTLAAPAETTVGSITETAAQSSQDALGEAPSLLLAAIVGALLVWLLMRSLHARRVARVARELERIGAGGRDEDFRRLQDQLPGSWRDIPVAASRAARTVEAARSSLAARVRDLEAILQSTAAGFIAIDPTHRVLDLNQAAASWLGVDRANARGRLVQEIARHPQLNRLLDDAMAQAAPVERTVRLEGPSARELHALSEPLRDAAGRTLGLLLSLQDVTQLRRLEGLRSEFVANVSHELRTPITAIKGYVETLLQVGTDDPARARKFLEIVQRNTLRLSNLVEDLLALASLEQTTGVEGHPLEFVELSAREVLDEAVLLLGPTAEAKRIRLVSTGDSRLRVRANRTLLEQAMVNLLSNAIRYSPEATTVTLTARTARGMCELSVQDEGPGIAGKHLERIFERFYRVDRSRTSTAGGTGLGLAIVKHIAQAHGGSVEVESELGSGSRFSLRLPFIRSQAELEASAATPGL
jgi:two-component system, OmpR family, phosphate regulon sensor histidine kinase PhoR